MPVNSSSNLEDILDRMAAKCADGTFNATDANWFVEYLQLLRTQNTEVQWRQMIELASTHPIQNRFAECPCVDHSLRRPRGYPGDAELIDYFYDSERVSVYENSKSPSIFGSDVLSWIVGSSDGESLRQRRDSMTQELLDLVQRKPGATVLSVAAGHAREWLPLKGLIQAGKVRLTALDQDDRSLQEIHASLGSENIVTINDSIVNLIGGKTSTDKFDFIYSMGLYDYLPDGVAERLTQYLYSNLLAPGGRMLIANYTSELKLAPFMEMFMRWDLVYRNKEQMISLARRINLEDSSLLYVDHIARNKIVILNLMTR